jgi:hypothetical protein
MTKLLEEALAKVATLPPAAQEKIGEELLLHVETVDRIRGELDKGIRSLDRGEGRELNIQDVIKRARIQHARE